MPEDERLFEGHPAGERGVSAAFWLSTPIWIQIEYDGMICQEPKNRQVHRDNTKIEEIDYL